MGVAGTFTRAFNPLNYPRVVFAEPGIIHMIFSVR
jgi:hypothetical protein